MKSITAFQALLQHIHDGKSDKETGEILHCNPSEINHLKNGKRKFESAKVQFILKMFPDLDEILKDFFQAKLEGRPLQVQQANGNTNSQISQTMGAADAADAVARYRQALSDAILSLDIPADAKVQVLSLLKQIGDKI